MNVQPIPPDPELPTGASASSGEAADGSFELLLAQESANQGGEAAPDGHGGDEAPADPSLAAPGLAAAPPASAVATGLAAAPPASAAPPAPYFPDPAALARAVEQLASVGRSLNHLGQPGPAAASPDAAALAAADVPLPTPASPGLSPTAAVADAPLVPTPTPTPPVPADASLPTATLPQTAEAAAPVVPLRAAPDAALPLNPSDSGAAARSASADVALAPAAAAAPDAGADGDPQEADARLGQQAEPLARSAAAVGTEAGSPASGFEQALAGQTAVPDAPLPGLAAPGLSTEGVASPAPLPSWIAPPATQAAGAPEEAVPLHVEWLTSRGGGTARLQLHPPNLGSVDVSVTVRGSNVDVVIHALEPAAQAAVAQTRELLADGLAARELRMDHFEVRGSTSHSATDGGGSGDRAFTQGQDGAFEGTSGGSGSGTTPGDAAQALASAVAELTPVVGGSVVTPDTVDLLI